MNRLGLCVNYNCNNYGSMLQIFATQKIIENYKWNYKIIQYNKRTWSFCLKNIFRIFNINFMHDKIMRMEREIKFLRYPNIRNGDIKRKERFREFRKKYLGPYSSIKKGYGQLRRAAENYQAVMVGSDQLWLPAGLGSKFYTLQFVPDHIRKISFATSFGINAIPGYQIKRTREYLKRIEHISVREVCGRKIIKELTGRESTIALDPTLMFSGYEWDQWFPWNKVINQPYIFAYLLGNNAENRAVIKKFARQNDLIMVTCPHLDQFVHKDLSFGEKQLFDISPIDFLNLIRNAEYICTDSFHGTVFSILYHKRFVSFSRFASNEKLSTNNRIESLLNLLGLCDRIYHNNVMDFKEWAEKHIDYDNVEKKLNILRKETSEFLDHALETD